MGGQTDLSVACVYLYPSPGAHSRHPAVADDVESMPMNGAVALPLDLNEIRITASGGSLVRRSVLPSGVRILSEHMPGAQSATVGFWVAVGSRDEQPVTFGSTHFLEHLLFKGTHTRTALEIAVSFDAVGGEHNALTAKEYTCYYAKVRDQDLPMAVAVLADMFTSSLIDAEEFESERGVILEELAMADDDPSDVVSERFFEAVFGEHPLGRPIGGSPAAIGAVGREAVWEHYRANYRPQDLVVTVAGAVDHDVLVAWISTALEAAGWDLAIEGSPVDRRHAGYSDAGLMGLYAGCSPKKSGDVAELMLGEFRRLAADGITDEELSRAQGQLGGGAALALEDSDSRMTRLGRSELTFGEFSDLDETLRRLDGVTTTQVRELAEELVARPL